MFPLDLLKEYLKRLDEVMLCELLDISAEDLVNMFEDKIRERRAYLEKEVELMEGVESGAEDYVDEEKEDEDEWN